MAYVYALDVALPANTDLVSQGAQNIRELKAAVRERINSFFVDVDTDPLAGKDGAVLGNTTVKALTPVADNTYALGTSLLRFSDLRVNTATFSGAVTLSSTLAVTGAADIDGLLTVGSATTAKTWSTYTGVVQLGTGVALAAIGNTDFILAQGAYYNAGWKYSVGGTVAAARIEFNTGALNIDTAAGGALDGAVTWSNKVAIANSGAVTLSSTLTASGTITGTSTSANPTLIKAYNAINSASSWGYHFFRDADAGTNSEVGWIKATRTGGNDTDMIFGTGSVGSVAEKMRIGNGGQVLIGTTVTTGAAAGELVLANTKWIRLVNQAGTGTQAAMSLNTLNTLVLAGATNTQGDGTMVRLPHWDTASFPAGSADRNGTILVDSTAHRLVYYSNGAKYYLAGVAF